ncbi:unnamed protein product [Prorocentrum cordatum]|uniref:Glucosylceramidase n=1 Tax=Prorocentrum cordatum TaxID=2364126 RepID=A0ABN9U479_9DINO|nr:unnamed protein product [Polarella glacialis]
MKTKPAFNGDGSLLPDCRDAWALHFVRFIEEVAKLDVPIWGVSVQNEPEEECVFVRDHLGPSLERAGLGGVKILVWDHNRDGMLERAHAAYCDPEVAKYIWGLAYHWYGDARFESWPPRSEVPFTDRQRGDAQIMELRARAGFDNVRRVAELRPDKHILFTEGCQELGGRPLSSVLGDWKQGERYAMNIIADLNSGCEGWIDWNLCLDETGGPNHVGNFCVAPVICDTRRDRVLMQPSYWYLGHFSRFIRPGARRVLCSSSRDVLEVTAFANPDGTVAVVVMNQTEEGMRFWLKVAGAGAGTPLKAAIAEAPPRSITTFVVPAEAGEAPGEPSWLGDWWGRATAALEDRLAALRPLPGKSARGTEVRGGGVLQKSHRMVGRSPSGGSTSVLGASRFPTSPRAAVAEWLSLQGVALVLPV